MNIQLSNNSKAILAHLLTGPATCKDVAGAIGTSVTVVSGSLAALKKNGFVEILPTNQLSLTPVGVQIVSPDKVTAAPTAADVPTTKSVKDIKKGDVKEAAKKIVDSMPAGTKRAAYIKRFMEELNMTKDGASTYHYNLVGKKGRWK